MGQGRTAGGGSRWLLGLALTRGLGCHWGLGQRSPLPALCLLVSTPAPWGLVPRRPCPRAKKGGMSLRRRGHLQVLTERCGTVGMGRERGGQPPRGEPAVVPQARPPSPPSPHPQSSALWLIAWTQSPSFSNLSSPTRETRSSRSVTK